MCGLAGRFDSAGLAPALGWSERAATVLAHRGPDGSGAFRDGFCELVHRRLALIDLSPTGRQPMTNEDGSVWVVFNGEIYNWRELRRWLEPRGHRFRGSSDTEVLIHLYEEEGAEFPVRLRGIFAFALYDRRQARVLLGRDRFGVKPLYLARQGDQWLFASEMKAILALPGFEPTLDRQACYDFVGLGYVPEPATGFANVAAVERGSVLTLDGRRVSRERFAETAARPDSNAPFEATVDALEDRLLTAVGRQALADVPVATLLSGGIDSGLVAAGYRRARGHGPMAFTVKFPDSDHDETSVAARVAGHCGAEHRVVEAGDRSLAPERVFDLLGHFDQPFADPSLIPTHWVSAAVRQEGIVCALSGDGGDEAFGGYARFWRANRLVDLMRAPAWALGATALVGQALEVRTRNLGRRLTKAAGLAAMGLADPAHLLAGFAQYLSERQKRELVLRSAREGLLPGHRLFRTAGCTAGAKLEEISREMTNALLSVSLPSDMLRKVDMMSMRAGVEIRVPLLDEEVVAIGLCLPHAAKTNGRQGKLVLRALARRWLPAEISRGRKHGFYLPLDVMAPPSLHRAIADLLLVGDARTRTMMDPRLVAGWITAFGSRGRSVGGAISREGLDERILILTALELWLRRYGFRW